MRDRDVMARINKLVDEEHGLLQRAASEHGLSPEDHTHLHDLEVTVDQLWDLLRQRRALRDAGRNPDDAHLRDASIVERYLQ